MNQKQKNRERTWQIPLSYVSPAHLGSVDLQENMLEQNLEGGGVTSYHNPSHHLHNCIQIIYCKHWPLPRGREDPISISQDSPLVPFRADLCTPCLCLPGSFWSQKRWQQNSSAKPFLRRAF